MVYSIRGFFLIKILILSFYYPPDIGPGSFRIKSLIDEFSKQKDFNKKYFIEVFTTFPNRYVSFQPNRNEYNNKCQSENIKVIKVNVPKHSSGMTDQAFSFIYYAFQVWRLTRKKKI